MYRAEVTKAQRLKKLIEGNLEVFCANSVRTKLIYLYLILFWTNRTMMDQSSSNHDENCNYPSGNHEESYDQLSNKICREDPNESLNTIDMSRSTKREIVANSIDQSVVNINIDKSVETSDTNVLSSNSREGSATKQKPKKWTRERLIEAAIPIHGDKFDYNYLIRNNVQINSVLCKFEIPCNGCHKMYSTTPGNFIHHKKKCLCWLNKVRWKGNLKEFLERAVRIHSDKYDYSGITSDMINTIDSELKFPCKGCGKIYTTTIDNFITKERDCPCWSNKVHWKGDVPRFITEAKAKHGDHYDYSHLEPSMIQTANSVLNLPCNGCGKIYNPTLHSFINNVTGCPCWARLVRWKSDLQRVLAEAIAKHGDRYDYSRLQADQIENVDSRLDLTCNNCGKPYNPTIDTFINHGCDCSCWSNRLPWKGDLPRVIASARELHGDKYDYSRLRADQIENTNSLLELPCNNCGGTYKPTLGNFIYQGSDCPCYFRGISWKGDLPRVIASARELHGDKYDYSRLRADQIKNAFSVLELPCNNCGRIYKPTLDSFIRGNHDCPCYFIGFPWKGDLSRVLTKANEIHGNKYDYSRLTADQIETIDSRLDLTCNSCGNLYNPTIDNFINQGSGCTCYGRSKGSQFISEILSEIDAIIVIPEYRHPNARRYPYDFRIQYGEKFIKIEYDGIQHFEELRETIFNRYDSLEQRHFRDRLKTIIACNDGDERFIRIDYTFDTKEKIRNFLLQALDSDDKFIVSTPEMYTWLGEPVTEDQFKQYVPNWYQQWIQASNA